MGEPPTTHNNAREEITGEKKEGRFIPARGGGGKKKRAYLLEAKKNRTLEGDRKKPRI